MPGYLLLAGKAVGAVPIASLPETLVVSSPASDMDGGDVGCEVITRGEGLGARFPLAGVST